MFIHGIFIYLLMSNFLFRILTNFFSYLMLLIVGQLYAPYVCVFFLYIFVLPECFYSAKCGNVKMRRFLALIPQFTPPYVALRYVLLRSVTFCSFVSWLIDLIDWLIDWLIGWLVGPARIRIKHKQKLKKKENGSGKKKPPCCPSFFNRLFLSLSSFCTYVFILLSFFFLLTPQ